MSTPYDPGRPEDRPPDQPGYPPAPPPQPPQQPEYPPGQQYPQAPQPDYQPGQQYPQAPQQPGYPPGQQYPQGPPPSGGYAGGPPPGNYPSAPQYAGAPQYGDPYGGAAPVRTPPREVIWASLLMFVQVGVAVLNAIIQLADADGFRDSIREASPNLTPDEVDAAYTLGVIFTVVIGLIFAALYLLLAIQVRKGKNWARIVTWVLAGLGLLFGLLGLAADAPAFSRLFGLVGILLDAAIIVLLAMRPSNEYFRAQKAPRY